ncbi:MAG TPA: uroporphyrinogen-III C-methyltransferase [Candidatus Dormibacteraeota bacterium]|nr:uroporphyrinogen-III C-methyltransferase [Candidatus Dormibacteraeota bacterium]
MTGDGARPGTVYLVGAGPGDPGLITVRGLELVETCDELVVDALASPLLLRHARPGAGVHDVGKRAGRHTVPQAEINALLVELARQNRSVVRLKGGDPFVFGRGGEECEALLVAGVAFEVVPGVTSAVAAPAYAGIPVTHREAAGHVTIVTGHERDGADGGGRVDHEALGRLAASGTLVFLMGARSLPGIVAGLVRGGADPATPAASVQWGTDPRQRTVRGTLATIAGAVEGAGLGAPMVTVVGAVAGLAEGLDWFGRRPLTGRRILVTRARAQASGFLERLRRLGADAVEIPVIAVEPAVERVDLEGALRRLSTPHPRGRFAVFTSANAVQLVAAAMRDAGLDARLFSGTTLVAIGPETAAALAAVGLRADLVPVEFVAEAVADLMIQAGVEGRHVWLPRAALARDVLPTRLRDAGAEVDILPLYRTVLPEGTAALVRDALGGPSAIDAVTFTSSSTVEHFRLALEGAPFPPGAVAACIGPVTARTAEAAGFPVAVVAPEHTTAGLASALVEHFATLSGPA